MIFDKLYNAENYYGLHPLFSKAFDFVKEYIKDPVEPGTYEICGQDLYVKVQNYETRSEGYLEVHDRYIDIQCMIAGVEKIYYSERKGLEPAGDYDEIDDVLFLKDCNGCNAFSFAPGEFAVFFPWDAHKPAMNIESTGRGKKLVFKVKVQDNL